MSNQISPQNLNDTQELLAQLFTEVSDEESTLSGGTKLGIGGNAVQSLRETDVTFGTPYDNLVRLTPKLFEKLGIKVSEIRKRQMRKQVDFYYMTLTVSMQPARGALFTLVECALDFGPKGKAEPIVQAIFPQREWRDVLSYGGSLNLGLNGDLEWDAGIDMMALPQEVLDKLPAKIKTRIMNKDNLKAFVVVSDYSFKLGRAEIAATGEGNSKCFWRIEKPELQETQTVQFGVVFKVPKGTTQIELTGLVAAEPDMNWLVANLRHVFEDLSDKFRNLFLPGDEAQSEKSCLPIGDHEKWVIDLPVKA